MAAAAADVAEINTAIGAARAAASGPTTSLVAAAEDDVSALAAALFGGYGREYQAVLQQAAAFHDQFVAALSSAGNAYAGAEAAASNALGTLQGDVEALLGGNAAPVSTTVTRALTTTAPTVPPGDPVTTLLMGPSGVPIPTQTQVNQVVASYITPFYPAGNAMVLPTPEGLYPLTGVRDLTFDVSVARGVTILNNAIQSLAPSATSTVNVGGYSQSSVIASMEMKLLDPSNLPYPIGTSIPTGSLNFVLLGDPSNPNGGLLTRFPGLSMPSLGLTFGTATPDNSFPTRIYTIEYDGFADFPQYPIDFLSDLNAFLGIAAVHGTYQNYTASQVLAATQLTNTYGPTQTQYFIIQNPNLPLLDPVRAIPIIGRPIADLVQPDLRVLVDLGYGSTTQGWSPDPPNVPTPFGVIPPVSPGAVLSALSTGTQQGIGDFANDVSAGIAGIPALPNVALSGLTSTMGSVGTGGSDLLPTLTSTLSSPDSIVNALQGANTRITEAISRSAAAAYATLLPTADIANAAVTAVPSYDVNLFLSGIEQVVNGDPVDGLIYAFGAPVAADVALGTLAGGFEVRVIVGAAETIYYAIQGVPVPPPG
jgi:PE-PPE domain/PE family